MSLKVKRHFPLWVLLILVLTVSLVGLGSQRIIAYTIPGGDSTVQAAAVETASTGTDISNTVALFDENLVHTVQILISDEDYQEMITTYQQTGIKEYFHADVIIDGVRINNVGLRLKGNASLRSAVGGNMGMGQAGGGLDRQQFDRQGIPDPENLPEGFVPGELPEMPQGQMPEAGAMPQARAGENFMQPGGGMQSDPDGTAKIPLMIKFDEFAAGQTYQGYTSMAIRTYGANYDAAMLQEPITNAMARLAGLPATHTAYAGVRLNDDVEELFVISELVNETYIEENFANANGVLYKAELGSTLSYEGEDPSAYAESFTQQTRVNDADMAPLIRFMKFLDESDDATFESQLPDYLDVDSFATYLALNDLLVNTDSMIGMNNNYYLYYDDAVERFTLLMWDTNESLGKLGMGSAGASFALDLSTGSTGQAGQIDEAGRRGMGGPGGGSNTLLTRFMSIDSFKSLYEEKLQDVYKKVFLSGAIPEQINAYADLIRASLAERSLVDPEGYESAVASTLDFVTQREEYLAATPLLSGLPGNP